jgi:hypothetical protein
MKKTLLIVAILLMGFMSANAQGEFKFGAGVNVGVPVGDAGDISSFTIGAEIQGEYMFSEKASGIATTGYTHFIGKDLGGGIKLSYGAVPILVGARVYPSEQFFIGGQIGYAFFTGDASSGGFAYKPQVGYNAGNAQITLSYNGVSNNGTISWIALSGVFSFGGAGSAKK